MSKLALDDDQLPGRGWAVFHEHSAAAGYDSRSRLQEAYAPPPAVQQDFDEEGEADSNDRKSSW